MMRAVFRVVRFDHRTWLLPSTRSASQEGSAASPPWSPGLHSILCSAENRPGTLFPRIPFPERVKALYIFVLSVLERLVPPKAKAFAKAFSLRPTRDSGRPVPSRARPFAFFVERPPPHSSRSRGPRWTRRALRLPGPSAMARKVRRRAYLGEVA